MEDEKSQIKFSVDLFSPADAEGIRDLFLVTYGDQYPVKVYYNPPELTESFKKEDIFPIVAKTGDGQIVGCFAIFRTAPFERLYEAGSGIVLPHYRKTGISTKLHSAVFSEAEMLRPFAVEGLWGEAVTNHVGMQKIMEKLGVRETGLEVDLMPAEAYDKEKSAQGRVGAVVVFKTVKSAPHTVFLPPLYEKELRFLYEGLDDSRTLEISETSLPDVATELRPELYGFAQVARISILQAGSDFARDFDVCEQKLRSENRLYVLQACVKLSQNSNHAIVDVLRRRGYFVGGLLPRWFNQDGLLMQRILIPPNWDGIHIYSDRAKKIRDMIYADWEKNTY